MAPVAVPVAVRIWVSLTVNEVGFFFVPRLELLFAGLEALMGALHDARCSRSFVALWLLVGSDWLLEQKLSLGHVRVEESLFPGELKLRTEEGRWVDSLSLKVADEAKYRLLDFL